MNTQDSWEFTLEDIEFSLELAHRRYVKALQNPLRGADLRILKKDLKYLEQTRMERFRKDIEQIQLLMTEVYKLIAPKQ